MNESKVDQVRQTHELLSELESGPCLLRDTPEDRERLRVALDIVQQAENQEGLHVPLFLHVDAILGALRGKP